MRSPSPFLPLLPLAATLCAFLLGGVNVPAQQLAPPVPTATPLSNADIIRNDQGSLVFVEGHEAAGSGFICDLGGQKFLFTNAHVLAGNTQINFTLLDGSTVRVGGAGVAVGHDMVRFVVAPEQAAFSALEHVNESLLVGDEVLVLGNAKGARVINPLSGKVVGVGPNLVEVDAPFQPGNSGSPIIQKKSGRVVGIATYAREDDDDLETTINRSRSNGLPPGKSTAPATVKLRRFGYRLDSVKTWQGIAWPEFQAEAGAIKKVDELTDDILSLIREAHDKGYLSPGSSHGPAIQRPLQDFFDAMNSRPSPADSLQARQRFLDSLRRTCQGDLADLRPRLRYDYFQREAVERQRSRDGLAKAFDEAFKAQTNTTRR